MTDSARCTTNGQTNNQTSTTSAQTDTMSGQTDTTSGQTDTTSGQADTTSEQTDTTSGQTDTTNEQTDTTWGQTDTTSGQTDATSGQILRARRPFQRFWVTMRCSINCFKNVQMLNFINETPQLPTQKVPKNLFNAASIFK